MSIWLSSLGPSRCGVLPPFSSKPPAGNISGLLVPRPVALGLSQCSRDRLQWILSSRTICRVRILVQILKLQALSLMCGCQATVLFETREAQPSAKSFSDVESGSILKSSQPLLLVRNLLSLGPEAPQIRQAHTIQFLCTYGERNLYPTTSPLTL